MGPYLHKNDTPKGAGQLGKNDIIWGYMGQTNSTSVQPDQNVNKAEEPTYLSINLK
jgi:hypothetical protein